MFLWCINLTTIVIPNSVTTIGEYAFRYCMYLPTVTIPSSVVSIGHGAFYEHLDRLTNVTFQGKTLAQVQQMTNYPWGITNTSIITVE